MLVRARMAEDPPMLARQAVRDLLWAFRKTLGADVVERGLAALPEDVRQSYVDGSSLSWLSYETVVAAHEEIARAGGVSMEDLLRMAVPVATEHAFRTVWRIFLRMTTEEYLVSRAQTIYARSRSRGEMCVRHVDERSVVLEVTGWADMPPRDILALGLSIQTFLRLAGRKEATVQGRATPTGAFFDVTWIP